MMMYTDETYCSGFRKQSRRLAILYWLVYSML